MTDGLRNKIIEMKEANPDLSHAEIGRRLNLNPGECQKLLGGKGRENPKQSSPRRPRS